MASSVDRAVSVSLDQGKVLVIRRQKEGNDYCVLPGGGVEPAEEPREAVIRELMEETGLTGVVDRHLWTIEHADRIAHYFLVLVDSGPMVLAGPEAMSQSEHNRHTPYWLSLSQLDAQNLQPQDVRDLLRHLE